MPLPSPEPIGLPAPAWLLQFLLVLTFSLHLVPMTLTVGGTIMAAEMEIWGRLRTGGQHGRLAAALWGVLPTITAFTITLGVAPLLFVQLLYPKFFYPASVLTGWSWMGVIVLLIVGYGGLYLQKLSDPASRLRPWTGLVSLLCFLGVSAIYVSTMSLTTAPEAWKGMYAANQAGLHFYFQFPRWLHIFFGTTAMAGALAILLGHLTQDKGLSRLARQVGLKWLSLSVALEVVITPWFLNSLSQTARSGLIPLLLWVVGGLAILSYVIFLLAERTGHNPLLACLGMGSLTLGGVGLAVQRHLVRQTVLGQFLVPDDWKLNPQWDVFAIFAVMLVVAIGLIGYLTYRFYKPATETRKATHHSVG